jgi:hypothetical protein
MKKNRLMKASVLAIAFTLLGVTSVMAASVEPMLFDPWQSGDAYSECEQAGCGAPFAWKVDDAAPNGNYYTNTDLYGNTPTEFEAVITISNSDGYTFDWAISEGFIVYCVIVTAGGVANVFYYEDGAYYDTYLYAPLNTNTPDPDDTYEISHVTFCFDEDYGTTIDWCEETAWAAGTRYVKRGNWATYTPYPGNGESVVIYAAQTALAGTATFTEDNGMVEIFIELNDNFIFYYDVNDQYEDDNIKVQDYATAPSGNPAPGLFDWKATAPVGSQSYTITVPLADYYGIHLDVAGICGSYSMPAWYTVLQNILARFPNAFPVIRFLLNSYLGC